ncbi:MAG: class I SAM-dependent methyltransferase family protein [Candidatus Thermoplasmatota archaeon]|nr:class I SAM-dependent methyltransferase family protein [Candidatus Thermoplasmatota archaeon]
MIDTPFNRIATSLANIVPQTKLPLLPQKWEIVGDVAIIRLPKELEKNKVIIAERYAKYLRCKTILNDVGGITGTYRKPVVEVIFGDKNTETLHRENGIRFKLDPQKLMFSSGNMNERGRMATISNNNEIVVDLFAGIGYFSVPMAVKSKPRRIYACELNPVSYDYLCQNIILNDVTSIVEPLLGDNREIAPKNVADRVIMGHIRNTHKFLQNAINCLKDHTGIIHYHDVFPNDTIPKKPFTLIQKAAEQYNSDVELITFKKIKSYAPGISHVVLDIKIGDE